MDKFPVNRLWIRLSYVLLYLPEGKTQQELIAMQQLYKKAYEKALKDSNKNDFDMGAGI